MIANLIIILFKRYLHIYYTLIISKKQTNLDEYWLQTQLNQSKLKSGDRLDYLQYCKHTFQTAFEMTCVRIRPFRNEGKKGFALHDFQWGIYPTSRS